MSEVKDLSLGTNILGPTDSVLIFSAEGQCTYYIPELDETEDTIPPGYTYVGMLGMLLDDEKFIDYMFDRFQELYINDKKEE